MLKFLSTLFIYCFMTYAHAASPLDTVLDDLQKSYSGGYSYSSNNKCTTTKSCVDYITLRSKQLVEKYSTTKEKDTLADQKIQIAQMLPALAQKLLETTAIVPQIKVFQSMSSQGQNKYRQGYRTRIPSLDQGFDILGIDKTKLSETDRTILDQLAQEINALMLESRTSAYHISHIQGISISLDDILSVVLDKLDSLVTIEMTRDDQGRAFVGIIDDVMSQLSSDDQNSQKLMNLRATIETESDKSPLSLDALIQFLQMNFDDPTATPDNDQEKAWKSQKTSFQPAKSPTLPTLSGFSNLSFDVNILGKSHHLTAKNVNTRLKDKERVFAQTYVYKDMSAAAQAAFRSGVRYTLDPKLLANHLFDPLNQDSTDAATRASLENLQDEFKEKVKAIMVGQKVMLPAIDSISGAYFDYDQLLNIILAKMEAVQNRPADRQGNLAIDLNIIDKVIEKLDPNDKVSQKLLALRQKIETGQSGSSYNSYGYSSNQTINENKSEKEWAQIKSQLQTGRTPVSAKIINLNDIRLYFTIIGHKQSVSLQDAGTANYTKRRLTGQSTKYKKEKRAVLDDLISRLHAVTCRNRDECKKLYLEEITATKAKFGGRSSYNSYDSYNSYSSSYNSYGSNYGSQQNSRANTKKAQEMDTAIQGMLDAYAKVITQAFDMDRPHTGLILYNNLSPSGQQNYLNGTVIGAPTTAKIFTTKDIKKTKEKTNPLAVIMSIFGSTQPATPEVKPEKPTDYKALETKLKPYVFYDTDDIIIYALQSLENATCRSFSECANSDTRAIETVVRTLNPNDPDVTFLQSVIDIIKAKGRTNPLDLKGITDAFIASGFSPRLKLKSNEDDQWNQILDQRSGHRKRAISPRIANKERILAYVKKKAAGTENDPMAGLQQVLTGVVAPAVISSGVASTTSKATSKPPVKSYSSTRPR